jgi:hypothetical protein
MKKLSLILIASVFLSLSACGGESRAETGDGSEPGHQLRLDNGKKWKIDAVTHVGMGNMQKLVTGEGGSAECEALKEHLQDYSSHLEL